jgi:pimeloyl-ACP methyl ester carboxylesterase
MTSTPLNPSSPTWSLAKGQVLRRVLRTDPTLEYFVYVPGAGGTDAPMFVAVHGLSRNAAVQASRFAPFAEAAGAVLVAPTFAADRFPDYQRLGRAGRGARADEALQSIVVEAAWLTGASSSQIHLFGHSGGAQFAHQYAMVYPDRVARAVVASAGWYTFPTTRRRFPYGIRPSADLPGVRLDPERFLRVPITVLVGENDGTDENLRHTERLDAEQGPTRVARARNWVAAMQEAAATYRVPVLVRLEQLTGDDHSFEQLMKSRGLGELVFEALFSLPYSHRVRDTNGEDAVTEEAEGGAR